MNSISLTTTATMAAAATVATAVSATMAHGGKMESIETIAEAVAVAVAGTASTSTPTSSLRSHLSNPVAMSNLATNLMTASSANCNIAKEFQTPNSIRRARNSAFHSLPIVNTPTPPSRYRKIDNPFEPYMTERLHKPLIDRYVAACACVFATAICI